MGFATDKPAPVEDLTDYSAKATRNVETDIAARKEAQLIAKPTKRQLVFQDLDLGLFIHFGLPTYTGKSSGDGPSKDPATLFNPKKLACEQWMEVAKSMGATYVVLTARHEGGFCIWPTRTTDYSVKSSPWKDGKGDVVREYVDACRKHGLKVGFYHSSWHDANLQDWRDGDYFHKKGPEALETFTKLQEQQLTELLTNYGPIDYLWFDHHDANPFWQRIDATVRKIQPDCISFGQDSWISGGHNGRAPYPLWYAQDTADGTPMSRPIAGHEAGHPWGAYYRAWEANTAASGHWFWSGPRVEALESLVDKYETSVGHGANFLPNFAPDRDGLMPPEVVKRAAELGDAIRARFGTPIAQTNGKGAEIVLDLAEPAEIEHVVIMEQLADGQKIAKYRIDAMIDGKWKEVASGQTVGHKRIQKIGKIRIGKLRFVCIESLVEPIALRSLAVH